MFHDQLSYKTNCICGVMGRLFASSAADRGFDPLSGQAKTMELVLVPSPLITNIKL